MTTRKTYNSFRREPSPMERTKFLLKVLALPEPITADFTALVGGLKDTSRERVTEFLQAIVEHYGILALGEEHVGANLYRLRVGLKISQARMGALLGIHQSAVSRVEKGEQGITPNQLVLLEHAYGVSFHSMMREGGVRDWLRSTGRDPGHEEPKDAEVSDVHGEPVPLRSANE